MRSSTVIGWFVSTGLTVTLGCGGGDQDGAGALQLVQTVPADLASEVSTDIVVTAEFDSALNEATVTTSSFGLRRDGGAGVEGTVAVAEETASFDPTRPLGLLSSYTATLTTDIESVSADTLGINHTWSFRTRDGRWGDPLLVETDDAGDSFSPQVAVDSNGNAVAVWTQSDGARNNIWANRYTPTAGWGEAELIETDNAGNAGRGQVALDPNGNAVAVWRQSDGMRPNIWANRYTPTAGWGEAELIETDDAGDALSPQVAVDPNGNAVAVWTQSDGARNNIWANSYSPAAGWGTAELIETDDVGIAGSPQVALDTNGDAVAVWYQSDGTRFNIWANRFSRTAGWGTAELIETDNADSAFDPQVAVDPNGNALAVWRQSDGTRDSIWANRFSMTAGWGTAELIETDNAGNAEGPQVGLDPNGNAVAVWLQAEATRFDIRANRFD